jgi:hypothetical protein
VSADLAFVDFLAVSLAVDAFTGAAFAVFFADACTDEPLALLEFAIILSL